MWLMKISSQVFGYRITVTVGYDETHTGSAFRCLGIYDGNTTGLVSLHTEIAVPAAAVPFTVSVPPSSGGIQVNLIPDRPYIEW